MDLIEMECNFVDWIQLTQVRVHWREILNATMKLQIPYRVIDCQLVEKNFWSLLQVPSLLSALFYHDLFPQGSSHDVWRKCYYHHLR